MIAYVTAAAGVEEVPQLEEGAHAHAGLVDDLHAGARGAVEHPRRDLEAASALVTIELANQHSAVRLRRPVHHQLLVEERVPRVAHAADLGIVGIAFGPGTTTIGRTRRWRGVRRRPVRATRRSRSPSR
jgi:hypothetical protein